MTPDCRPFHSPFPTADSACDLSRASAGVALDFETRKARFEDMFRRLEDKEAAPPEQSRLDQTCHEILQTAWQAHKAGELEKLLCDLPCEVVFTALQTMLDFTPRAVDLFSTAQVASLKPDGYLARREALALDRLAGELPGELDRFIPPFTETIRAADSLTEAKKKFDRILDAFAAESHLTPGYLTVQLEEALKMTPPSSLYLREALEGLRRMSGVFLNRETLDAIQDALGPVRKDLREILRRLDPGAGPGDDWSEAYCRRWKILNQALKNSWQISSAAEECISLARTCIEEAAAAYLLYLHCDDALPSPDRFDLQLRGRIVEAATEALNSFLKQRSHELAAWSPQLEQASALHFIFPLMTGNQRTA